MGNLRALAAIVVLGAAACGGKITVDDEVSAVDERDAVPKPAPTAKPPHPGLPNYPKPTYPRPYPTGPRPPFDPPPPPFPYADGGVADGWQVASFERDPTTSACATGKQLIRLHPRYLRWVGVELCSSTRYKIYMAEQEVGPYYPLADSAGGGEDHCELVHPSLSLPAESSWEGSNCKSCTNDFMHDHPVGALVYTRATLGTPFQLEPWPEHNHYTSRWYECGVRIP